jgi:hypothetical protein
MNELEVLLAAKDKIMQGWCKGAFAKDLIGNTVNPESDKATRWCAVGAMMAVANDDNLLVFGTLTNLFREYIGGHISLPDWQDQPERTQEDVLQLFDLVIQKEAAKL